MQRIIPFEGKAKEKKETLATLFGERMLGSMPSDEVGTSPACRPTDGPTEGSFAPSSGECHSALAHTATVAGANISHQQLSYRPLDTNRKSCRWLLGAGSHSLRTTEC